MAVAVNLRNCLKKLFFMVVTSYFKMVVLLLHIHRQGARDRVVRF